MDEFFRHITRPEWGAALYQRRVDHNQYFYFSEHKTDRPGGVVGISPHHLHLIAATEAPHSQVRAELRRRAQLYTPVGPGWAPPGAAQATLNRPPGLALVQPDPAAPFVEAMRQVHQRHYGHTYVRPPDVPHHRQSLLHRYGYSVHQGGLPPCRRLALLVEFLFTELPRCWPDAPQWHQPASAARLMKMERHLLWLASFVGAAEVRAQAQRAWMDDFDALTQAVYGRSAQLGHPQAHRRA